MKLKKQTRQKTRDFAKRFKKAGEKHTVLRSHLEASWKAQELFVVWKFLSSPQRP